MVCGPSEHLVKNLKGEDDIILFRKFWMLVIGSYFFFISLTISSNFFLLNIYCNDNLLRFYRDGVKGHVISLGEDSRFNHTMESKSLSKVAIHSIPNSRHPKEIRASLKFKAPIESRTNPMIS